jgi:geranylgeranyl pyrophosphate synthase
LSAEKEETIMQPQEKLMEQIQTLLVSRSQKAIVQARRAVIQEQISYEPLRDALRYFMEEIWFNAAHPALLSLTCEAVGGDPEATTDIAAALVLLTGAADIHDDLIDESVSKDSKSTLYGKYGKDVAIIAGDVLWFKGMLMLNDACEAFPTKKKEILELAKQSFFEIGSAEAKEANLRRNLDLQPEEYMDIIKMKVSIAEGTGKIGAIVGNGSAEQIEVLGQFGKALGVLMTIRDEFVDMFELDELKNRFKNECLPLPILVAFQDADLKKEIIRLLEREEISEADLDNILDLLTNASEVHHIVKEMRSMIQVVGKRLSCVKANSDIFIQMLESTLEDLPS